MFRRNHYINLIALVVIAFVGSLFLLKYAFIYTGLPDEASLIYLLIFISVIILTGNSGKDRLKAFDKGFFRLHWLSIALLVFFVIIFVPRIGEIGRYPAIVDWLELFVRGDFPYNSQHTPSGFPFLFIFSYPFYLLGNIGFLVLAGIIIFGILAINYSKSPKENVIKSLLLFGTPAIYYAMLARDELFTNMVLVIGLIFLSGKYLDYNKADKKFFLFAVLFGLVLSTRSVVGLIYIIYFLYLFRNNIPKLIQFSSVVIFVFVLLLLPFIIWDPASFFKNGPFAVQSYLSHLPIWNVIVLLLVSIYIGWIVKDLQEVLFACGIMLFSAVLLSMIYTFITVGFYEAIINDVFDISYFIFPIPFLILSIKEYKTDRYLGKIISVKEPESEPVK